MAESTFTPGPWKANGVRNASDPEMRLAVAVWTTDKKPICTTDLSVGKYKALSAEEQDANARLIAAAPDLLAAAQHTEEALYIFQTDDVAHLTVDRVHDLLTELRDAIAKATI